MHHHIIADEDHTCCEVVSLLLKKYDIQVDTVHDGRNLLKMIKDNPARYSTIWIDINLPKKDGLSCTAELRASGFNGKIVGLTTHLDPDTFVCCSKAGMSPVLAKPLTEDMIKNQLTPKKVHKRTLSRSQ